jgi:hypothetical protein
VLVRFADTVDLRDPELQRTLDGHGASDVVVAEIAHSIAARVPAGAVPQLASLPGVRLIRLNEPVALPRRPTHPGAEAMPTGPRPPATAQTPADPAGPAAPTGLRITDTTETTVTLTWDAPAGSVDVTAYRLYERRSLNRFASLWALARDGIASPSTTVTGLAPGSMRTYAVAAVDAAGRESARSTVAEVRTLQAPRAYHPIHRSSGGVFAIVGDPFTYDVDALGHPAPEFSLVAGPAGMSVDARSGLVRWTPTAEGEGVITVTVRATNSQGRDDHTFSVPVHPAGTDRMPPSPVWSMEVTGITANGCTLSWQAATDNVGVAGYLILAQPAGRGESLLIAGNSPGPGTAHTVTTLKPGVGYRLWVAAYDAAGNRATISGVPPAVITTMTAPQDP